MHPTLISALAADNQRRMLDRAATERLSHEARRLRRGRLRSLFAAVRLPHPRPMAPSALGTPAPRDG